MPRPSFRFCVPFNDNLELEEGWRTTDKTKTHFFSSRFHFAVFRIPDLQPATYFGEPVDTVVVKKGIKVATELSTKYTLQATDIYKTVQNSLVENSLLSSLSSELSSEVGVPKVANLSSKLTSQLQTSVKTQFSNGFEVSRSTSTTEEVSYKETFAFEDVSGEALICPTYRKVFFDVHLTHWDFLVVDYQTALLGLRKKRQKHPAFDAGRPAGNVLKLMLPIGTVGVWKLNQSVAVKWRGEEFQSVLDPFEITTGAPKLKATPAVDTPEKPSLYQLSNAAFPTRWTKRRGPWTEQDLKQAEQNESQGTAWWYQYGPGRDGAQAP
jgi:hypothetical protein